MVTASLSRRAIFPSRYAQTATESIYQPRFQRTSASGALSKNQMENKLNIVHVIINDLIEAEYNPRQMTEKQVSDLTASIKEFGLVDPILVNSNSERKNVIIGGHQRVKIARTLARPQQEMITDQQRSEARAWYEEGKRNLNEFFVK